MTATQAPRVSADPRPVIVEEAGRWLLAGGRCTGCGHAATRELPRCPWCRATMVPACFGPGGTVWAVTVLHVAAGDREAPYTLAYVDLDDGPRVLAHVVGEPTAIGGRVRLTRPTAAGDPAAEAAA